MPASSAVQCLLLPHHVRMAWHGVARGMTDLLDGARVVVNDELRHAGLWLLKALAALARGAGVELLCKVLALGVHEPACSCPCSWHPHLTWLLHALVHSHLESDEGPWLSTATQTPPAILVQCSPVQSIHTYTRLGARRLGLHARTCRPRPAGPEHPSCPQSGPARPGCPQTQCSSSQSPRARTPPARTARDKGWPHLECRCVQVGWQVHRHACMERGLSLTAPLSTGHGVCMQARRTWPA